MDLIQRTIELANANVERGGRPFACIIARRGEIIAEAVNLVAKTHDPTAHAEICAIREAAAKLGSEHFTGQGYCSAFAISDHLLLPTVFSNMSLDGLNCLLFSVCYF